MPPQKNPALVSFHAPICGASGEIRSGDVPSVKTRIEDALLADALTLPAGEDTRAMARDAGLSEALIDMMLGTPRVGSFE